MDIPYQTFSREGLFDKPGMKSRPAIYLIVLVWAAAFFPYLSQRLVVGYDAADFFFPDACYLSQCLKQNTFPLYNPYILCGYPKVADPQSMYLQPLYVLLCKLIDVDHINKYTSIILIHLLLGSCYFFLLLRGFRLADTSCFFGVLVFMLGGSATARLQHSSMIVSYSTIAPVLFHGFSALHARRKWLHAAAMAVFLAILLTDLNHVSYLGSLLIFFFLAHEIWLKRASFLRDGLRLAAAAAGGMLLAAIALVPVLLLLSEGSRGDFDFERLKGGIVPLYLLQILFPKIYGAIDGIQLIQPAAIPQFMQRDLGTTYLYIGTVPIAMILRATLTRRKESRFLFFLVVTAVALIYSFGEHTDLYKLAFHYVPLVDNFQRAADASFLANLALGVVAAYSAEALARQPRRERIDRVALIALLYFTGIILISLVVYGNMYAGIARHLINTVAVQGLFLALVMIVLVRQEAGAKALWVPVLLVVTLIDLYHTNVGNRMNGHQNGKTKSSAVAEFINNNVKLGEARVELFNFGECGETQFAIEHGIEQVGGYNPLRLQVYDQFVGAERTLAPAGPLFLRNKTMSRLMGVKYLVTLKDFPSIAWMLDRKIGPYKVYRDDYYQPRIHLLNEVERVQSKDFDSTFTTNGIRLALKSDFEGKFIIHNVYCKGWIARADGALRPVDKRHGLFMSVDVRHGERKIELSYSPWAYALYRALGKLPADPPTG